MTRADEIPEGGLLFVKRDEFDALKPSLDFVPGLLHDATVALIYGPPGSAKTFFALHLLCSTALGRAVFGESTEQREGLYIGLEGERGIKNRIKAWCAQNGVDSNPIDYALGALDLADDDAVSNLIERINRRHIRFVVIDTLALAMVGLDEISGQHVGLIIERLHRIKRETGACVLVIDHTGKNEKAGARGHSSKLGNVDTSLEIIVHNKESIQDGNKKVIVEHPVTWATPRSVIVHKQRDAEGGGAVRFRFTLARRETDVRDARGRPMASLAVDESEQFKALPSEEPDAAASTLTALQREAADIVDRLNAKLGRVGPATEPEVKRALRNEEWGPKNAASWRSTYRNLRKRMELDAHGCVERIA